MTPPLDGLDLALDVARHLSTLLHLIAPHGGHQPQLPSFLLQTASRFIAQGSPRGLNVSCVQGIGAPTWPSATPSPGAPGI